MPSGAPCSYTTMSRVEEKTGVAKMEKEEEQTGSNDNGDRGRRIRWRGDCDSVGFGEGPTLGELPTRLVGEFPKHCGDEPRASSDARSVSGQWTITPVAVLDMKIHWSAPADMVVASAGSVVFPRGLSKLKALHTLECVDITRGEAILQDIKRLTRLHKLAVTGVHKKNCQEFCSTLSHLTCLESLFVGSQGEAGLHGCLDGLSSPPKTLRSLKLWGALDKLPEWIAGLHNLVKMGLWYTELTEVEGTIQVLGKLPNLSVLRLWNKTFKTAEPCCFATRREALFPSLTLLVLEYEPGIGSVEFEEGTAPKLELLFFRHSTSFSGLSSLPSLKEVRVHEALHNDDMKDTRAQLAMNPNKPVLKFIA
nr:unnamed protein product [Digitaria exilis]